jgi:hypothetical protein
MNEPSITSEGAIAAHLAFTLGITRLLISRGLLSEDEITNVIDIAMHQLEELGLSDPEYQNAHETLERLLAMFSSPPLQPQK